MDEKDIFDELVAKVVEEAKNIPLSSVKSDPNDKKGNPFLTVNELVKTRSDILAKDAELRLKEQEIKNDKDKNTNDLIKTAVTGVGSIIGTISFANLVKTVLKFEETGHAVTTSTGRTLLSCLKVFKK